jgi:hypothetical protein
MKADKILVGYFYISKKLSSIVREVVEEAANGYIYSRSYDRDTGKPSTTGTHLCSRKALGLWAECEASPHEVIIDT